MTSTVKWLLWKLELSHTRLPACLYDAVTAAVSRSRPLKLCLSPDT